MRCSSIFTTLVASAAAVMAAPAALVERNSANLACTVTVRKAPAATIAPAKNNFFSGVFARLQVSEPVVYDVYAVNNGWTWKDNGDGSFDAGLGLTFAEGVDIASIVTEQWPGTNLFLKGSWYDSRNIQVVSATC